MIRTQIEGGHEGGEGGDFTQIDDSGTQEAIQQFNELNLLSNFQIRNQLLMMTSWWCWMAVESESQKKSCYYSMLGVGDGGGGGGDLRRLMMVVPKNLLSNLMS